MIGVLFKRFDSYHESFSDISYHLALMMFDPNQLLAVRQVPFLAALIAAVCFALYIQLRSVFRDMQHPPEEHTITRAKARVEAEERQRHTEPPYLTDAFPGGRQFKTVYGTIQVFEWGPEEGEKVLMVHGLGTPCIALGDMAKEFVSKGYRVMIFGESCICHPACIVGRGLSPPLIKLEAIYYSTKKNYPHLRFYYRPLRQRLLRCAE